MWMLPHPTLHPQLVPSPHSLSRAFDNRAKAVRPEKRLRSVLGVGKLLSVLQHSKNSKHLLSTYVLCALRSRPHLIFTKPLEFLLFFK